MFPPRPIHLWMLTLCTSDSHLVCSLSSQVAKSLLALSLIMSLTLFYSFSGTTTSIIPSTPCSFIWAQLKSNTIQEILLLRASFRFSLSGNTERKCFNQLGGSFNFFFILACPEKGNYILAGLMCGHDTIYTLKCSLTAPRQPIISLFFSGRDESLSDAGNLVNFVVKRCTKSNGFGVSLLTKTE
jgi:hypothetical protein